MTCRRDVFPGRSLTLFPAVRTCSPGIGLANGISTREHTRRDATRSAPRRSSARKRTSLLSTAKRRLNSSRRFIPAYFTGPINGLKVMQWVCFLHQLRSGFAVLNCLSMRKPLIGEGGAHEREEVTDDTFRPETSPNGAASRVVGHARAGSRRADQQPTRGRLHLARGVSSTTWRRWQDHGSKRRTHVSVSIRFCIIDDKGVTESSTNSK